MIALVLTAGGARGAYQAGVLRRIGEMPALRRGPSPFQIVSGASAGAINGTMIAAGTPDFGPTTAGLARIWERLEIGSVVRTDARALGARAAALPGTSSSARSSAERSRTPCSTRARCARCWRECCRWRASPKPFVAGSSSPSR